MPMPQGIGIVDLMLGFPITDHAKTYDFLRQQAKDGWSKESTFPVEYMFKGVPYDWGKGRDPIEVTLEEMDKWGIQWAPASPLTETGKKALIDHPNRFFGSLQVDPNALRAPCRGWVQVTAAMMIPASAGPQVAIKANGKSRPLPLFITASYENPNPQVMAKVITKKAMN